VKQSRVGRGEVARAQHLRQIETNDDFAAGDENQTDLQPRFGGPVRCVRQRSCTKWFVEREALTAAQAPSFALAHQRRQNPAAAWAQRC
jgi:hypothetical protein